MDQHAERVSGEEIYRGRIFDVTVDRVRMPSGREVTLEIVRHPGSVVIVPMPDPASVILIRQFRYAVNRWLWEIPAGTIDPGEGPEAAARRECHEEIGLQPRHLERLGAFFPTPGFCDEVMILYRATELVRPDEAAALDEDEEIEASVFGLDEALGLVRRGEIQDMKTVLGLSLLTRR